MIINRPKKKKKISRYVVLNIIMIALFTTFIAKLVYLQIYKHEDYKERADISSTRLISENAPRGKIYDSDGNILATNIQTYTLTYTKPNDENENFYDTMNKVFDILSENGEKYEDDLMLKIDSNGKFYFDFKTDDKDTKKIVEIRFKRDRGLNEEVEKNLFEEEKKSDLTDEEIEKVNNELLKISAEETFYKLVKTYSLQEIINPVPVQEEGESNKAYNARLDAYNEKYDEMSGKEILDELLTKYSIQDVRKYMVIKDAIKMQSFKGYRAVTIASNIKKDTAFIVYQKLNDLPGIDVSIEPIRFYPYNSLASGVIGYLSSIDSSKEENYELRGYDVSSDLIGVAGIEAALEDQLKGTKGGTTVKVNSKGRVTEELFKLDSYPGNNVHLTIDKDTQYAAEQAMKDTMERIKSIAPNATRGAVVAIEVKTGRIIAMVSYPGYDPNVFSIPGMLTDELSQQYFSPDIESYAKEFIQRTGATGGIDYLFPINEETGKREDKFDTYPKPFFNYATQGLLPAGSTFKPLTAIAGLMENVVTTDEVMQDNTGTWSKEDLPGMVLKNFQGTANGATDLRKALQVSSNYYFYELGYRLYKNSGGNVNGGNINALDTLAKYAWKFGLGVEPSKQNSKTMSTGIQIEESFGQVYNFESWKNQIVNTPMYEIVDALKAGNYYSYSFVPLNIEDSDNDPDNLKEAKTALKNYMKDTLAKVGTDEEVSDNTKYAESLVPYIKKVMDLSDEFKAAVIETSKRRTVNIDEEAGVISDAIAYYIISNAGLQIKTPGQLVSSAIGQGMNNFTPVQIANYVATLANGGTRLKLTLVDKITSPTGEVLQQFEPEVVDQLDIPEEYLQAVKEGMYRVNTSPSNGTAYDCFGKFPINVAGKTGTADFSTDENYKIQGRLAYGNYISFAPMEDPEIAIFSTIYDGFRGSEGATIHKAIYEAYFKEKLLELDPSYASKSESFRKYVLESPLKDNKDDSIKLSN
ncbi:MULTISPECIES: penicillin-binding transpeptidase domain-containing protein [unclassified Clostridium]|uniref:penicillin-binding transpeptidase domain-containing protein n=1 Tax=unclassified Clostridium TaxID=2614128 RepID=UPI002A7633C0|nr:penicillin-binding transpeptidase domain-containing protein [Clostridium sp.]MCI6693466.1 penicillin-binding protein [Clostridium sp.]MDY2629759.1 penicillin-binding transpeptidase domain-containing protein [Clostridium sp.]